MERYKEQTIQINMKTFQMGALAMGNKETEQLFQMTRVVVMYQLRTDSKTVAFSTSCHMQTCPAQKQAERALAKKLLWFNLRIHKLTGRPFIESLVREEEETAVTALCSAWIEALQN